MSARVCSSFLINFEHFESRGDYFKEIVLELKAKGCSMSRRDTIIIAVLLNAGIMVMLFISALKKDPSDLNVAKSKPAYQKAENVNSEKK